MSVNRTKMLPTGHCNGKIILPESIATQTRISLMGFSGPDGQHEGLIFWLGQKIGEDTLVTASYLPSCKHGQQYVFFSNDTVGRMSKTARAYGLCVVAQVHSHSDSDTRHSDGDDDLILMPREGFFSIIVGNYGSGGITLKKGVGLHQFQSGRWVKIVEVPQHSEPILIVPTVTFGAANEQRKFL